MSQFNHSVCSVDAWLPTHLPLLLTYHCYSPTIVTHLPLLLTYHCYSPTIVTHLPLLLTYHCYSPTIVTHLPLLLTYHCYSPTIVTHLPLLLTYHCCVQVYKVRVHHTRPQGLLFLCFFLIFIVLALNVLIYEVAPQYTTYGSQHYWVSGRTDLSVFNCWVITLELE